MGGRKSNVCPIVRSRSLFDQPSIEMKVPNPAAIISKPRRLSGRRHQAITPARTYARMTQTMRAA